VHKVNNLTTRDYVFSHGYLQTVSCEQKDTSTHLLMYILTILLMLEMTSERLGREAELRKTQALPENTNITKSSINDNLKCAKPFLWLKPDQHQQVLHGHHLAVHLLPVQQGVGGDLSEMLSN
jgi:hypothetical protein